MNQLHEDYGDLAAFFVIYIREAHPSDSWQMPSNLKEEVVFASPNDIEGRSHIAQTCVRKLGLKIPALLDDFDDSTDKVYTGWPDRMYVIDRDGRIAYKGNPGPFGFKPDQVKTALLATLEATNER